MDMSEAKRVFDQTERLYEQHGKPLEAEHWGKYVAIHQDGKTIVDEYLDVVSQRAWAEWGESPASINKVGERQIESEPRYLHPYDSLEYQEKLRQGNELGERLYEQYGKPLESEHWGKYLAVHPDGRTVLTDDYEAVKADSLAKLGKGFYLFKVGPKATRRVTGLRLVPTETE